MLIFFVVAAVFCAAALRKQNPPTNNLKPLSKETGHDFASSKFLSSQEQDPEQISSPIAGDTEPPTIVLHDEDEKQAKIAADRTGPTLNIEISNDERAQKLIDEFGCYDHTLELV